MWQRTCAETLKKRREIGIRQDSRSAARRSAVPRAVGRRRALARFGAARNGAGARHVGRRGAGARLAAPPTRTRLRLPRAESEHRGVARRPFQALESHRRRASRDPAQLRQGRASGGEQPRAPVATRRAGLDLTAGVGRRRRHRELCRATVVLQRPGAGGGRLLQPTAFGKDGSGLAARVRRSRGGRDCERARLRRDRALERERRARARLPA